MTRDARQATQEKGRTNSLVQVLLEGVVLEGRQSCLDEHRKGTQPLLQPSRQHWGRAGMSWSRCWSLPAGGRSGPMDGTRQETSALSRRTPPPLRSLPPCRRHQHAKLPSSGLTSSSLAPHDALCLLHWEEKVKPLRAGMRCPAGQRRERAGTGRGARDVANELAGSGMMHSSGLKLGGRTTIWVSS